MTVCTVFVSIGQLPWTLYVCLSSKIHTTGARVLALMACRVIFCIILPSRCKNSVFLCIKKTSENSDINCARINERCTEYHMSGYMYIVYGFM